MPCDLDDELDELSDDEQQNKIHSKPSLFGLPVRVAEKKKAGRACGFCRQEGHTRKTCSLLEQVEYKYMLKCGIG